jgi:hypothetical protein
MLTRNSITAPGASGWFSIECTVARDRSLDGVVGGQAVCHHQLIADWLGQLSASFLVRVHELSINGQFVRFTLEIDAEAAENLTPQDVVDRFNDLYPDCTRKKHREKAILNPVNFPIYRAKLHNLSEFMRHFCGSVAGRINKAEDHRGNVWQGRFHSTLLADAMHRIALTAATRAGRTQLSAERIDQMLRPEPTAGKRLCSATKRCFGQLSAELHDVLGAPEPFQRLCARLSAMIPVSPEPVSLRRQLDNLTKPVQTLLRMSQERLQDLLNWLCSPRTYFAGSATALRHVRADLHARGVKSPPSLERAIAEARFA